VDLTGKVALITGAGGGIGRATAVRFAEAGARVGLTDMNEGTLAQAAALLPDGAAVTVAGDITDPATIDELATAAVTRFGRVDALFNNVGIQIQKSLLDTTVADFDRIMHVNCLSYLIALQRVVPEMRRTGGGSVINVSSVGGLVALPNVSVYGASKSAVIGLTRSAAAEFAPDIRVNAICPGGVSTPDVGGPPGKLRGQGSGTEAAHRTPADQAVWPTGGDRERGRVPGQRRGVVHDRGRGTGRCRAHHLVTLGTICGSGRERYPR
jgi:NAD(P)-dependent dehydrogenase (short-subunit alcohol dehydrogenase family)